MYESGENYLETILIIKRKKGTVRSIDIANELRFSKPSVSRAVGLLKKKDYIDIDKSGYIEFTKTGEEEASRIYERHKFITDYFIKVLGVPEEVAEKDACRVEHVISNETFLKIKNHMQNIIEDRSFVNIKNHKI